jgi:uncharacterized protein with PIN domain
MMIVFKTEDVDLAAKIVEFMQNNKNNNKNNKSSDSRNSLRCQRCNKDIFQISKNPKKTIQYSLKFHGGFYCYNCQQILKKERGDAA